MKDCKHQWITTKISVTQDDNYHPPRSVEVPVERICSICGFITSNFGENTWDEGRLYHVNGYWDNVKEVRSFEDVELQKKQIGSDLLFNDRDRPKWMQYCPSCGSSMYEINGLRDGWCLHCNFEFERIKKKELRVKDKEKKKRDLAEDLMFYVWMPVILMILYYMFLMILGLV